MYAEDLLGKKPVDIGPAPSHAPLTFNHIS